MKQKFDDDEVFEPECNFTRILISVAMIILKKILLKTLTKTVPHYLLLVCDNK